MSAAPGRLALCAGLVASVIAATALPASAATPPPNPLLTDAAIRGYQQPSVALDPGDGRHLAVAFMDGNQKQVCGLATSSDGGQSWSRRLLVAPGGLRPVFPTPTSFPWCWNAVVAFGPDGTLYYAYQESRAPDPYSRIRLVVSRDGGSTFEQPRLVDPNAPEDPRAGFDDWWPDLAVDPSSGQVDVVWDRYPNYPQPTYDIVIAASTDGGRTFAAPVRLNTPDEIENVLPAIDIAADGSVYVTWIDETAFTGGPDIAAGCNPPPDGQYQGCLTPVNIDVADIAPRASPSQARVTVAARGVDLGCPGAPWISAHLHTAFPHSCDPFHYYSVQPRVAASPAAGRVYLTWYEGSPQQVNRLRFTTSSDGARTWAAPRVVAGPAAGHEADQQILPWLSVSPAGRIDIVYYNVVGLAYRTTDLGLVPTGSYDVDWIASTDGGMSFAPPVRLSETPSNLEIGPIGFDDWPTYGMHLGAASLEDRVLAAWSDTRRGSPDDAKQDIAFGATGAPSLAVGRSSGGVGSFLRGPFTGRGRLATVAVLVAAVFLLVAALRRRRRPRSAPRRVSADRRGADTDTAEPEPEQDHKSPVEV